MSIISLLATLSSKFISYLAEFVANTSTYACIAWWFEEPKTPNSLLEKQKNKA